MPIRKSDHFIEIFPVAFTRLREGRNILQDIRSGEEQYFTGPNQNLPDRKI